MSATKCLTCDTPLRFKCDTKWKASPIPPCPECGHAQYVMRTTLGIGYDAVSGPRKLYCKGCDGEHDLPKDWKERTVESRRRYHDKPGPYGDGFFCSQRCAHIFAVAMAKAGYRLAPREQTE